MTCSNPKVPVSHIEIFISSIVLHDYHPIVSRFYSLSIIQSHILVFPTNIELLNIALPLVVRFYSPPFVTSLPHTPLPSEHRSYQHRAFHKNPSIRPSTTSTLDTSFPSKHQHPEDYSSLHLPSKFSNTLPFFIIPSSQHPMSHFLLSPYLLPYVIKT